MLKPVFEDLLRRTNLNPSLVEDITVGNVLQIGSGEFQARIASFLAGFPYTTSVVAINRLCSSGLEACAIIASKIKLGSIDIGIGAGVENMSMYDMNKSVDPEKLSDAVFEHEQARNCLIPMGVTSENVAEKYNVSKLDQDKLAVDSHRKAAFAQEQGLFDSEIVSFTVTVKDKDGNEKQVVVNKDDGIRKETTVQSLQKLKPAFKKDGSTTAGNASQVTEGAAGVLLARRSVAQKLGLPILAKFVTYSVSGVPPEIMGVGPAFAIPEALKKAGLKTTDIDIYEINEAFASQALYCCQKLGLDMKKVNPKGGAIALGHPLGCTGARQIATLIPELKRQKAKYGVVSMCIGSGMGAAAVIQNEQN
ncbi:hypothetical protein IMG5_135130 [Ichthyophthirius multifiliis]|uniref:acetyl-CoA C-acyltransferase n=1 Tax=Ichthyophthirius multifiliis TaxID=5932 RepID=G0QWU1_ICHMU|nr:hypothetical protein IMG5_135130 [Ichthyophthirius multifiliis]EGR30316.1 hypothetical protein IMG5_135130 [Ichthyophthirius multifiliis]|eukprot:XP_004031903.1 hypothetical protein IMG5_135130 [Ichthyophthirius multifiliis]